MTFATFAEVATPSDQDAMNRRGKQVWTCSENHLTWRSGPRVSPWRFRTS